MSLSTEKESFTAIGIVTTGPPTVTVTVPVAANPLPSVIV